MKICKTVAECRATISGFRGKNETVSLVPTMGFLHRGHMSLINLAQSHTDRSVVSIFVNPTQFGNAADLDNYPRDEAHDLDMLEHAGVDVLFIPDNGTIYPQGDETIIETTRLANILHGRVRPGHFRGVTTVVARLFNIVQPDIACFGEKDYQQLQVIKRMVSDLHMPIKIVGGATVREHDGLALSSRNVRLSSEDRAAAVIVSKSLNAAENAARPPLTAAHLANVISESISTEPRAVLKGLDIVKDGSLEPVSGPLTGPIAIMISVAFGDILLIDQRIVTL